MRSLIITACLFFSAFSSIPSNQNKIENVNIQQEEIKAELTENEINPVKITFEEDSEETIKEDSEETFREEPIINFIVTDEKVYATCSVNVRSKPTVESDKLGTLSTGNEIKRIGIGDNGWSKVIYKDKECYINSKYLSKDKPVVEEKVDISFNPDNYFIKKEGNVSDYYIIKAESYWNKIPVNVRQYLINGGIQIYVTDTNLAKRFYDGIYSSIQGVTVYDTKTCYIEDREKCMSEAVIHECGHVFDSLLCYITMDSEFLDIYYEEKDLFGEAYAATNPSEYFAESFQRFILDPEKSQKNTPNTYQFMMDLISRV